jgi:hypothetical protein
MTSSLETIEEEIINRKKNMCLTYIKKEKNNFPRTYNKLKNIAEKFEITNLKELLILWEDVVILSSVALNLKEYGDEYIKIKKEIEENIILEEQKILNNTLNDISSKNVVKKRI